MKIKIYMKRNDNKFPKKPMFVVEFENEEKCKDVFLTLQKDILVSNKAFIACGPVFFEAAKFAYATMG